MVRNKALINASSKKKQYVKETEEKKSLKKTNMWFRTTSVSK